VGGALWLFDNNHRVYPPRDPGQPFSSRDPIWTEFWVERKIVGETSRSWILTGRDARKVPKAGGPGGEAAEDIKDVQALRRFTTKDTLYFQVYVYNLNEEAGAAVDAVLQAQLRQGETLVAASSPQPVKVERKDGALLPQTNGMPLAGLPAGRYALKVVVADKRANATASRDIDFSVE
jgi:hypothetical protein